jgi:hypothetical protein
MDKDQKILEIEDLLSKLVQEKEEEEYLNIIKGNEYLSKYDELMNECETEKLDDALLDEVLYYLNGMK